MTTIPAAIAAEVAVSRQNVALSVIKQSAEQAQALVELIAQAAQTAPISPSSRGNIVNTSA